METKQPKIEDLILELSKFGNVQIAKADYVLTILVTGNGLSKYPVFNKIMELVTQFANDKYPIIENMRNDETFFCAVCKPNSSISTPVDEFEAKTVNTETELPRIPRRNQLGLWTIPERIINKAIKEVEELGSSPLLTDAVIKLDEAFNLVADYVDSKNPEWPGVKK